MHDMGAQVVSPTSLVSPTLAVRVCRKYTRRLVSESRTRCLLALSNIGMSVRMSLAILQAIA